MEIPLYAKSQFSHQVLRGNNRLSRCVSNVFFTMASLHRLHSGSVRHTHEKGHGAFLAVASLIPYWEQVLLKLELTRFGGYFTPDG